MILGGVVTKGNVINLTKKKYEENFSKRSLKNRFSKEVDILWNRQCKFKFTETINIRGNVGYDYILRRGVQIFTFEYIERYTFKIFYKRNTEDETYIRLFLGSVDFTLFKQ